MPVATVTAYSGDDSDTDAETKHVRYSRVSMLSSIEAWLEHRDTDEAMLAEKAVTNAETQRLNKNSKLWAEVQLGIA